MKRCDYCFKVDHLKYECPFIFSWYKQRLLWIGQKENDCIFSILPREMILEIISYTKNWQPFQDLIPIVIGLKPMTESISGSTININSRKNFMKFERYFKNVKCYNPNYYYCIFRFYIVEFSEKELFIIQSYGLNLVNYK